MSAQTSIGANDGRIQSTVVGSSVGPFTVDFPFFSLDDVVVTFLDANGAIDTLVRGVDYTLTATANDDGIYPSGTVDLLAAVTDGVVTRYRTTPLTRASQLPLTGYLDRTALNADLNKTLMALQDQLRIAYNTLRFPEEDGTGSSDRVLPPSSEAPNSALLFDANSDPYYGLLLDLGVYTGVSSFSQTVLDDTTAVDWLTTLGWSSYMQGLKGSTSLSTLITALGTAPVVAEAIERFVGAPTGRLTLETGVPVSSTDQAGKATIYYTPAGIGRARYPVYDGANWTEKTFSELSNDTTASATNNAGAAAAGPYQIQDCFVWSNAGTNRLTRGPKWIASATATMTIATPCVVTWTAHGLWNGATVRFTTTGALPTGLTASTDYFVTKIDANTFNLSTTLANQVAGTKIATSGTQSGVHTAFNYTSDRGTGAATTELQLLNGIYVNKYDITNGPLATKGTYVGSVYFNASSQIDLKKGSSASGGGEAIIGLWNQYNRVSFAGAVGNTATWAYASPTIRAAGLYSTNRVTAVSGNKEDSFDGDYGQTCYNTGGAYNADCNVGFRSTTTQGFSVPVSASVAFGFNAARGNNSDLFLGLAYLAPTEAATSNGWTNVYGASLNYRWRY